MNLFPEYLLLQSILETLDGHARVEELTTVLLPRPRRVFSRSRGHEPRRFTVYGISLGTQAPEAPVFGLVGGVHGLERIGTEVVLSYFISIVERLRWDLSLQRDLEQMRIIFVPLLNPVGMYLHRRSNGNGVDLMRNAPVDAEGRASFLVGGQRLSPWLPWYRGRAGEPMEPENVALCEFVQAESFLSRFCLWIDVHSGYGIRDRIWFPYAKSLKPFPNLAEVYALKKLFDSTYPYNVYKIEPQAHQYTTHGDLWDFLYEKHRQQFCANELSAQQKQRVFLPLTLEMGSWLWIRKNPLQIFSLLGPFNPIKPHRKKRVLRRHLTLFDFLQRAVLSYSSWALGDTVDKQYLERKARAFWYSDE